MLIYTIIGEIILDEFLLIHSLYGKSFPRQTHLLPLSWQVCLFYIYTNLYYIAVIYTLFFLQGYILNNSF